MNAGFALRIAAAAVVTALFLVGCSASIGATSTGPPATPVATTSAESLAPTPALPSPSPEPTSSPTLPSPQAPSPTQTSTLSPPPSITHLGDCYFSPGQLSVKFTAQLSSRSAQDAFAAANGLHELSRVENLPWIRYQITDGRSELDKASELRANPLVANAIPILVCPAD